MVYGYIKCGIAVGDGIIVCVGCGVKVSVGRMIVTIGAGNVFVDEIEFVKQPVRKIKVINRNIF